MRFHLQLAFEFAANFLFQLRHVILDQSVIMVMSPFTAEGMASAILALSKAARRLSCSISNLNHKNRTADISLKSLGGAIKSFDDICNLLHTELDELIASSKIGSAPPHCAENILWHCLAMQVEQASRGLHVLDPYFTDTGEDQSDSITEAQPQLNLESCRDHLANVSTEICRHTENLCVTLLTINV